MFAQLPKSRSWHSREAYGIARGLPVLVLCMVAACSSPTSTIDRTVPLTAEYTGHVRLAVEARTSSGAPVTDAFVSVSPRMSQTGMNPVYTTDLTKAGPDGRYVLLVRKSAGSIVRVPDTVTATIHARTANGTYSTELVLLFGPIGQNPPEFDARIVAGT